MKHIVKKIAMILIIVMIANCFTGCELIGKAIVYGAYIFVGTLVVGAVVGIVVGIIAGVDQYNKMKKRGPRRANPWLFENNKLNAAVESMPEEELDFLMQTFYSLPEKELNLFVGRLNSLSKKETVSLMDSLNLFSEDELAAMVGEFNSMQETEIVFSLETLNSLPKTVSLADVIQREVDVSRKKAYEGQGIQYEK